MSNRLKAAQAAPDAYRAMRALQDYVNASVVTRIGDGVTDGQYSAALEQFNERELVELTMAIVTINGWNRLSISFQTEVGPYKPVAHA